MVGIRFLGRLRFRKIFIRDRPWLFGVTLGIIFLMGLYYRSLEIWIYKHSSNVGLFQFPLKNKADQTITRCSLPLLEPLSAEIESYIYYEDAPNCAAEIGNGMFKKKAFSVRRKSIVTNIQNNAGIKCCYRSFFRKGENQARPSEICHEIVQDVTQVPDDVEFIEVMCNDGSWWGRTAVVDGFVFTPRKIDVEERISKYENSVHATRREKRLSVVIIGIDGMSRMNFLRAMPLSNAYLLRNLNAISLNGYTKVGENSLPNLTPFLTGKTLNEFRRHVYGNNSLSSDSIHLDGFPFIWKRFAENGYRTGFAEDAVDISIFNMYWRNAFIHPPTDYYLRPFSVRMQLEVPSSNKYCYGAQLSFEKLLGNIKSMAETFTDEPYFQFTWSTRLGHSDFNKMRWGDLPLLTLLQELHKNNYLNHTALFIVSDHGSRSNRFRSTNQGKLEDRLPMAYIVLPKWFQETYKDAWKNLKSNQNLVTSAFDMHKTFYDLMSLDSLVSPEIKVLYDSLQKDDVLLANVTIPLGSYRGTSLFRWLPDNRNCFQAGVPLHWCVCNSNKKRIDDKNEFWAYQAANFTVKSLNKFVSGNKCYRLTLKNVTRWESRDLIRDGCVTYSVSFGSLETREECNSSNIIIALQIAFTVSPSDGEYETIVIRLGNGEWYLMDEVVRMDLYWQQGDCVEEVRKPFCYCEPVHRVLRISSVIVISLVILLLGFLIIYYFCYL